MDKLIKFLATGLGLGMAPFAPGTFGTLLGTLIYYFLRTQPDLWYWRFVAGVAVFSIIVAHQAERIYKAKDCQKIVIDEVAGMLLSFFMLPVSWPIAVTGFFLFRAFDMFKIYPVNRFEPLPGSTGIMMDDLIAGIYTNLTMQLAVRFSGMA